MRNILILITYSTVTFPVMAYLDPGFGSVIIQSLVVIGASVIGFLSIYWQKIKSSFGSLKKKNKHNKK